MMNFEENQKHKDRPGAAEHAEGGSPLLELEDWAWASLLKIHSELKARLTGKEIKGSACKCQLQLLEEKKYDELETALIEKCKSVGFCLGDEIEGE
ncbi:MAG: hypothetical protein HQ580_00920, partial [Planctomycetes bacterium]|nr:hypothetical protein [Planctomycetota bacterium]